MADLPEQTFTQDEKAILNFMQELCIEKKAENMALAAAKHEMQQQLFNRDKEILRLLVQDMTKEMKKSGLIKEIEVSHDGILFVEIPNYSQKKAAAMIGKPSFYSDDFYSDLHGYRMCARIYLNGDGVGKGSHLSIFFAIKKGRYDKHLSWPFQRRVTFTLLNEPGKNHMSKSFRPDPASSSFQKPIREMNSASGFPMFVPHKLIENPKEGFVRNDTIFLQVKVDPFLFR